MRDSPSEPGEYKAETEAEGPEGQIRRQERQEPQGQERQGQIQRQGRQEPEAGQERQGRHI